jgi:hypothetical protein
VKAGPLLGATLAGLLLAACTSTDAPTAAGRPGCTGVTYAEVRGPAPAYGPDELGSFTGDGAVCAAYWLPGVDERFVPQGIAVDRGSVWVSGYQWSRRHHARLCGLVRVDRRTGRPLARERLVAGAVGHRDLRVCRHGGGLASTSDGLWLLETRRLWLLDPELVGTGTDPVRRGWLLLDPLRGSVLVEGDGSLGIGGFSATRRQSIHWFDRDELLSPGVLDLTVEAPGPHQVGARHTTRAPTHLQGADVGRGGTWMTRSNTCCGAVVAPSGRRVAAPPGIEDLELAGHDLWAVSESGTKGYQERGGRPMVPMVLRLDADDVLGGPPPDCEV